LLVIWSAVVFLFFSASGSKLAPYVLPIFPAAALLVGRSLAREWSAGALLAQVAALIVVSVTAAIVVPILATGYPHYARWISAAFAAMAVAAGLAGFFAIREA